MEHELKIEDNYLLNLLIGRKKAEVRKNDRDYQVGDTLVFLASDSVRDSAACALRVQFRITHIHSGLGLAEGYVVLSVERVEQ